MILCGIDLGYSNLGLALVGVEPESVTMINSETVGVPRGTRPEAFARFLGPALDAYMTQAEAVGAEALTTFSSPREGNVEVFIKVAVVAGIATECARRLGVRYRTVAPQVLKKAVTGSRRAPRRRSGKTDKTQMVEAARRICHNFEGSNHVADAMLAALTLYAPDRILSARPGRISAQ